MCGNKRSGSDWKRAPQVGWTFGSNTTDDKRKSPSFFAGAFCTWSTRYHLARLAHTVSLQSPWRNSVLLLTLLQGSTQHASHINNHILSPHSNTLARSAASLFHFPVQFALCINNSTSDKMEESDRACFLFMPGRHSVQLNVEPCFFFYISFPFCFLG